MKLSDYVALQAGIPEAPNTGFTYGRHGQTQTWTQVASFNYTQANYAPIDHTHPYVGLSGNESINGEKVFNNSMGIGVAVSPSYGLNVAGSINVGSGSNFFVNGAPLESFVDAPSDGNVYGRSNGGWVLVSAEGGTITNLSIGYYTNYVVVENTGGQDATINAATASLAGIMSSSDKAKLDAAISGADLSVTKSATQNVINNTGGSGVTLSGATASLAGLMTNADKSFLDSLNGSLDADTLGGISSSGFLRSDTSDTKTSGNLRFNDNVQATFGNSDDTQFYYSGSVQYMNLAITASFRIRDNGTDRFIFDDGGDFTADGDVTAYSDVRLKENITPIYDPLQTLSRMQGVRYTRKDRPETGYHIGFIAQELNKDLPEAVKVPAEEGEMWSVNYGVITALLVEAIKELKEEINAIANQR